MRKGPLAIDFAQLWQEGMKNWQGELPARMQDDALEEAFWAQSMAKKQHKQTDAYAAQIFTTLSTYFSPSDNVLEIGPGWGNYTFPLQEQVASLTAVDSSQAVIDYLTAQCQPHCAFIHAKWEDYAVTKQYDVILGVNCFYRMQNITAALQRMNDFATKRAIIGMTSGPIQPHYTLLERNYGYNIRHPRRDYIDLVNILYSMGIYANCKLVPLQRTYQYASYDELLQKQCVKIMDEQYTIAHLEEALAPFVYEREGNWYYQHDFHAVIIDWQPQKFVL